MLIAMHNDLLPALVLPIPQVPPSLSAAGSASRKSPPTKQYGKGSKSPEARQARRTDPHVSHAPTRAESRRATARPTLETPYNPWRAPEPEEGVLDKLDLFLCVQAALGVGMFLLTWYAGRSEQRQTRRIRRLKIVVRLGRWPWLPANICPNVLFWTGGGASYLAARNEACNRGFASWTARLLYTSGERHYSVSPIQGRVQRMPLSLEDASKDVRRDEDAS
jgi:hypothetical protein